jgi:hypothetical protein
MRKMRFWFGLLTLVLALASEKSTGQTIWTNKTILSGSVGSYRVIMTLAIPYGGATSCFTIGKYYYTSTGRDIDLCSSDDVRIVERVNGNETGYFILNNWNKRVGQSVIGTWYSMDGRRRYPVTLRVIRKSD